MRLFFLLLFLPNWLAAQADTELFVVEKNELLGKFEPSEHPDFTVISPQYTSKKDIYLRREAYLAFERMHNEAKKEGVQLLILSATRNFNYQKAIWERKWNDPSNAKWQPEQRAEAILRYSSMPGSSRHHWGTDIDLNSVSPAYFKTGKGAKEYAWLINNATRFGFVQTYTNKASGRVGYEEEQWHWSYVPLAMPLLNAYNKQISYSDFEGFLGSETAERLRVIENYVNGVSQEAKK
jgi:D-alanyl-D-alanine carboxypeptidase